MFLKSKNKIYNNQLNSLLNIKCIKKDYKNLQKRQLEKLQEKTILVDIKQVNGFDHHLSRKYVTIFMCMLLFLFVLCLLPTPTCFPTIQFKQSRRNKSAAQERKTKLYHYIFGNKFIFVYLFWFYI
jgi:hypothetical protein